MPWNRVRSGAALNPEENSENEKHEHSGVAVLLSTGLKVFNIISQYTISVR
jgi:hypothetical protein